MLFPKISFVPPMIHLYCTLTLFCRLPSLNLEKMGKIGAKVPIPDSNVVPRYVKKILDKKILV